MADCDRGEYRLLMRRLLLVCALLLLTLALAGGAPAETRTYTSHQLHAAIPDGGTLERSIVVPDAGPVSFAAVGVRIVHPRDSDLSISLVSPRGTAVPLSTGRGGDGANFGTGPKGCSGQLTWFESDALDPIATASAPFAGELRPERPLTALYGQEARGRWTLRVTDGAAGAAGTLLCWQLELSRNVVSHVRVTRDAVAADLSYRESNNSFSDLQIAIRRHGIRTLTAPLSRFACHNCVVSGYDSLVSTQPLTVRDLDGDGEPEVLVDLFTGGAHCCFYTVILRFTGRTYRGITAFWGDPGYGLQDLDHDGRLELVSADDRFAYQFTYYAASALPVQIWHYDHGVMTDVTSSFPAVVRSDAATLWAEYVKARTDRQNDMRGVLAAWLADEYRLGLADEGWAKIHAAYARGELSTPRVDPIWPAGQKYLSALRSFLAKSGY
jgi:subtilisin-like proprotein convertase family protein